MKIRIQTELDNKFKDIVSNFDKDLFLALKPKGVRLSIKRWDGIYIDALFELEIALLWVKQIWIGKISDVQKSKEKFSFIDIGVELPSPISKWRHLHLVLKKGKNRTIIIDEVDFKTRFFVLDIVIYPFLFSQFYSRKKAYRKYFKKIG